MIIFHKTLSLKRIFLLLLICGIGVGIVSHFYLVYKINKSLYQRTLFFFSPSDKMAKKNNLRRVQKEKIPAEIKKNIKPFLKADVFDADADDWGVWSTQTSSGVLVFDANSDGRPDVYFCQNGMNKVRPTDKNGFLKEKPRFMHNSLYINQGNDSENKPIYKQLKELVTQNTTYVYEELLVENFLYPRRKTHDSLERQGRQSVVAVSADFNGDGLLDLYIGNALPGIFRSHKKTQRILDQFVSPIERQARAFRTPLANFMISFIQYIPSHNLNDKRNSERGEEAFGANSLFLNTGDKDGDGLPEWKDVSKEAGVEGQRNTYGISVADIDSDGDLDIITANVMDPDYWPGGAKEWAGGLNQIYINQLVETGVMTFKESSMNMHISGSATDKNTPMQDFYRIRHIPFLPREYSLLFFKFEKYKANLLEINGRKGEDGQISWAIVMQDVNSDGYPDFWLANDLGPLRLYMNNAGKNFQLAEHALSSKIGSWMSFAPADFNGDLKEDLFIGNTGGSMYSNTAVYANPYTKFAPALTDSCAMSTFINGYFDPRHAFIDGENRKKMQHAVKHSKVLPPDVSLTGNIRGGYRNILKVNQDSIDPYEFSWGSMAFDVQNDGKQDLYFLGNVSGRGGGIFPVVGSNPGRLLVNTGNKNNSVKFVDLTAEYKVFNIKELNYSRLQENLVSRKSPSKNWSKRDIVYSTDKTVWGVNGYNASEQIVNHDLMQVTEQGRAFLAADLNNDGFEDMLIRNLGGYDSRSSNAKNLNVKINGQTKALPPPNPNHPPLTEYEPGKSFIYLNKHVKNNWIKIRVRDLRAGQFNRFAVGAKIIINGKYMKVIRSGSGSHVSNTFVDLNFGLRQETVNSIRIQWAGKEKEYNVIQLKKIIKNTTITLIRKNKDKNIEVQIQPPK